MQLFFPRIYTRFEIVTYNLGHQNVTSKVDDIAHSDIDLNAYCPIQCSDKAD